MSPLVPRLLLVSAVVLALAPALALAQEKEPVVLEAPLIQMPGAALVFSVKQVGADGTVRMSIFENYPPNFRRILSSMIAEGYYLLVAYPGGEEKGVLRVQVVEVAEGFAVTVRTTPEAAARVKAGDRVHLVRPFGSTTAILRGLPDLIPMAGDRPDPGDLAKTAQRSKSINNLKQIGLALHNFRATMNRFPAAVIYGPDGKPWHSWRVLILPYIEQVALFNEYDFNQPWDSDKNSKLLDRMPDVYRDPVYGDAKGTFTHYAALVGPRAAFPPQGAKQPSNVGATVPMSQGGRQMLEFIDGTSNTWAVAPVDPGREIPWTKPDDISVGLDFPGLGKPGGIATPYTLGNKPGAPGVAPILYTDGSVRLISATIQPSVLNALLTVNGQEIIAPNAVPSDPIANRAVNPTLRVRVDGGKATATIE